MDNARSVAGRPGSGNLHTTGIMVTAAIADAVSQRCGAGSGGTASGPSTGSEGVALRVEAAEAQVADQGVPDAAGAPAGADDGDRAWAQQRIETVSHGRGGPSDLRAA